MLTLTESRQALARCVHVEPADFARDHWGRSPLLSRARDFAATGRLPGYADLLSLDDVDELLSQRGLRTPFLRIAQDGELLPGAQFTGPGGAGAEVADQVLDEKVLDLYAAGATLVLQGLHRLWPPLISFAGALAGELSVPVAVNAYLTPAGSRGFASHYDTHDVFVLQVAGQKRWRIHEPVFPDPLERQPSGAAATEVGAAVEATPALDVVLESGDALYLPRGWIHAAEALGEQSLHLTLGLRGLTRYALVEALLDLALEHAPLRSGFPVGLDITDPVQLAPELAATAAELRRWLEHPDAARIAARLRRRVWRSIRPEPIRPLAQLRAAAQVGADTVVQRRPGLRWRITAATSDRIALVLSDRTITFPAYCEPALRLLLASSPVRVGDLPFAERSACVTLTRRMLREAVVVPVDKP
ncbi:MAG: cupin-like domain-containing protein [Jiangellaceae bacterium]|nr:cupin-like domain-containing protein [Jiangellaceae bacterium]